MGRAMAGTGLDRLSVLPSGLANQRHTMRRIGIAMAGGPNPAESIDLVVLAERLGSASTGVAAGLAATSAPCLVACAMRTSRILGAGPRSSWMPGSCETSVCAHGGVAAGSSSSPYLWLVSQPLCGTEYAWHNRRIGMYSCSPLEYTKACARATARCAYSDVSLIWRKNPSRHVVTPHAQRRAAIWRSSSPTASA